MEHGGSIVSLSHSFTTPFSGKLVSSWINDCPAFLSECLWKWDDFSSPRILVILMKNWLHHFSISLLVVIRMSMQIILWTSRFPIFCQFIIISFDLWLKCLNDRMARFRRLIGIFRLHVLLSHFQNTQNELLSTAVSAELFYGIKWWIIFCFDFFIIVVVFIIVLFLLLLFLFLLLILGSFLS